MTSTAIDPTLEHQIADYLAQHPDFFDRHPDTLSALTLQHETQGAISLVERQLRQLRQHNQTYRSQLDELLQVARTNAAIDQRLHQLILKLMGIGPQDAVFDLLCRQVQSALAADAVAIKLYASEMVQAPAAQPIFSKLDPFFQHSQPCCGRLPDAQARYLFGELTGSIGSVVLIPLKSTTLIGLLAIGDHDPARFNAEQGVDFLQRLADVVHVVLQKCPKNNWTSL